MENILRLFARDVEVAITVRFIAIRDGCPVLIAALRNKPRLVNNHFQPVSMGYFLSVHRLGGARLTLLAAMARMNTWLSRQLLLKI
jgi:hypothetical protein